MADVCLNLIVISFSFTSCGDSVVYLSMHILPHLSVVVMSVMNS